MYHRKVIIRPDGDAYRRYCFPSISFPALSFFSLSFLYSPLPIPQLLSAVFLLPGLPSLPSTAAPPLPRRLTPTSPPPHCLSTPPLPRAGPTLGQVASSNHGRGWGWGRSNEWSASGRNGGGGWGRGVADVLRQGKWLVAQVERAARHGSSGRCCLMERVERANGAAWAAGSVALAPTRAASVNFFLEGHHRRFWTQR